MRNRSVNFVIGHIAYYDTGHMATQICIMQHARTVGVTVFLILVLYCSFIKYLVVLLYYMQTEHL